MSDDHYTSGTGHFGDQSGDAGQQKQFVSPASRLHEKMDPIQKEFWDRGIMIEVRTYKEDFIRGTREIFIAGSAEYIDAARAYCQAQQPPIALVYHKTDATRNA